MFFGKMALILAILPKNISNVNDNITQESLSINDLLESIEFLTRSIIARRDKKFMGVCDLEIAKVLTRARVGGASVMYFVADLPSKKLSLQKIFGSNLSLHGRVASGNPFPHYAELRSARENFNEKSLTLIAECLLKSARTYFSKNS